MSDRSESPRSARATRSAILFCVLLVAVCGFIYELVIVALGTYLFGNSVYQLSIAAGVFVSAMGIGSLAAKPLLRRPLASLVAVETLLALVGGFSALLLFSAFAWLNLYQLAMISVSILLGALVGCEIPLLLTLLQKVRREDAGRSAADLFAADYLGAVIGGVAFPFLLLPHLGQINAAILVGALNASAGLLLLWLFRDQVRRSQRVLMLAPLALVLGLLGAAGWFSSRFEHKATQALYEDPILLEQRSAYQQIVITQSLRGNDTRLFLNGDLQFASPDEYRYHEALVHPAMNGPRAKVLVLGGGDGLALREVLRYPDVKRAVEVELDPEMIRLARTHPILRKLNRNSLEDPRVEIVTQDAFRWAQRAQERFDVIVVDFPDPDDAGIAKLYSREMYSFLRRLMNPRARLVVQAGSPYFAPHAFWSIRKTVESADLRSQVYHVEVPSFGDWGYVIAAQEEVPVLGLSPPQPLRGLDQATLDAAQVFAPDRREERYAQVGITTLNRPRIMEYERIGWKLE